MILRFVMLVGPVLGCRFVAYLGEDEVDARALVLEAEHNLLTMATARPIVPRARCSSRYNASQFVLRNAEHNLDGFGVSWYESGRAFPRRVRSAAAVVDEYGAPHATLLATLRGSASPRFLTGSGFTCESEVGAPSNEALRSTALIAHVRAASTGAVDERNSHPFAFNTLAFAHNGAMPGFGEFKERLRRSLRPQVLELVLGETDSEHAGALFANALRGFPERQSYDLDSLRDAMRATLRALRHFAHDAATTTASATDGHSDHSGSSLNFVVTDGKALVVVRYRSSPDEDPPTLYYKQVLQGERVVAVVVSSEPQETEPQNLRHWTLLGKDRMLSFSPTAGVELECLDTLTCDDDLPLSAAFAAHSSSCSPTNAHEEPDA